MAMALFATMALMLASRAVGSFQISFRAKAAMAMAWLALIVLTAFIASRWLHI